MCHLLSSSFSNSDLVNLLNIQTCSAACFNTVQDACAAGLTNVVPLSSDAVRVFHNLIQLGPPSVHGGSVNTLDMDNVTVVPISDRSISRVAIHTTVCYTKCS